MTLSVSPWWQFLLDASTKLHKRPALLVVLGGAIGFAGRSVCFRLYRRWFWCPFPGPRERWILGPKRSSDPTKSGRFFDELYARHCNRDGKKDCPVSFRFLGQLIVMVGDKDDIKYVLDDRPDNIGRSAIVRGIFDTCIDQPGLFTAEDQEWRCQRRVYAPAFSNKNAQSMLPIIAQKAASLADRLQELQTVEDGTKWFRFCTTDVVSEAAFGLHFDYMKGGNDQGNAILQDCWDHLADARKRIFNRLLYWSFVYLPPPLASLIKLNADKFARTARMRAVAKEVIGQRKAVIKANPEHVKNDLLDQAILSYERQGVPSWSEEKAEAVMTANFLTFFVAGSETTAFSLAWVFYFLCANPEWQERCREQARAVAKESGKEDLGLAELERLTLLRAVCRETARLQPTAWQLFLSVKREEAVQLRGVTLPPGTVIATLLRYCTHTAPEEAPAEWRPQRWLAPGSSALLPHSEALHGPDFHFGAGRRVCPGRHMAELELMKITSVLLLRFSAVELMCDPAEVREYQGITIMPHPLPLRFRP